MDNNLIFLNEAQLDKAIYRIFSFERLEQLFSSRKLTLVKPAKWDDPFENFILKSTVRFNNGQVVDTSFRNNFYGLCWSLARENDAMWRIYSHDKDGVKVKTTIRKLFAPIFSINAQDDNSGQSRYNHVTFIGKVQYEDEKTLKNMLIDSVLMNYKLFDNDGRGQASTFMFKRREFKHEREIRLIHNARNDNESDLFRFDIDPFTLFDEIIFDPRMKESLYLKLRDKVRGWGYFKKVEQSNLYKLKDFKIVL